MSFEVKLAVRYFRSKRKSLARFTAAAAVVGIAAGVASLIVAQALARGFSDEMRDKILANTAHIAVYANSAAEIANWREISETLRKDENITAIAPVVYESAVLVSADSTNYAVLRVENRVAQSDGEPKTEKWNYDLKTVSIGAELAAKSGLRAGDEAEIVTIETGDAAAKHTAVRVEDIFQTGIYEYDATWIRASPDVYARLRGRTDFAPTVLSISVRDIYDSDAASRKIRAALGDGYRVIDWQEANRPLFAALSLEKVALVIISLIIFIAALNITTTLALLAGERRLDIAVLRTCGATTRSLTMIFLLEGTFLSFVGITAGAILGLLGCVLGNYFKIVRLSAEVYSLSYVPLRPDWASVSLTVFITFVLCLAAIVYPARRASRVKPLENLRNQ